MDTKYVEEYQDKLLEWQKSFLDTCLNMGEAKFPENLEESIKMQEKIVANQLEIQENFCKMVLDTQKELSNQYFDSLRKLAPKLESKTA